jgi:hypothetical protein
VSLPGPGWSVIGGCIALREAGWFLVGEWAAFYDVGGAASVVHRYVPHLCGFWKGTQVSPRDWRTQDHDCGRLE